MVRIHLLEADLLGQRVFVILMFPSIGANIWRMAVGQYVLKAVEILFIFDYSHLNEIMKIFI